MASFEFLSPEWLAEVEKSIRSRIMPESINYASTTILTVFENCPDGSEKALYVETQKGMLAELSAVNAPYPRSEFKVSGEYQIFIKVFKSHLDPMSALMGGELHFEGNMMRAMGMISLIEPLYKVLSEIPSDFN